MKQKFNIITSTCVPLPLENVDTDQIIPAQFPESNRLKKGLVKICSATGGTTSREIK